MRALIGPIGGFEYGEGGFFRGSTAPVQGTGTEGPKLALALLYERPDECPGALPILAVHDEIVLECDVPARTVTVLAGAIHAT